MVCALIVLGVTAILLCLAYVYMEFRRCHRYWLEQGVPTEPATFPSGHLDSRMAYTNFGLVAIDFYEKFKSKGDYVGLYFLNKPVLFVLSPEFAKTVLVRDFQYFVNRGVYFNKVHDPLSANLFFIENGDWRRLRTKMTPTFTSGKIKMMFHTIFDVGDAMVKHLTGRCQGEKSHSFDVEVTDLMARYNTDVIVSCAFGTQCNSLSEPDSQFRAVGKKMLAFDRVRLLKLYGAMLFRREARALGFRLLHADVSKFIIAMCKRTIEDRRSKQYERRDFMQLMIDLYREHDDEDGDGLSLNDIAAQVFLFFFAGFETSSTAMTYTLYELALNPHIQQKVRDEIADVISRHNGNITYDSLMEMTYLDQVIYGELQMKLKKALVVSTFCTNFLLNFPSQSSIDRFQLETMRMHPAVGTLHRIVTKDYALPNGGIAPKGTYVVIPAVAFHMDPTLFPNPQQFDPDRFTDAAKSQRHPFAYLPFGEGPRICIGVRFGMLQTKLGLAMLLRHFLFETCARTQIPIRIDNVSLLLLPCGGVWLRATKL